MPKTKLLLFTDWFYPGFRAGGPIRSCVNFVAAMKEHYQIYVVTSDTDAGEPQPYKDIVTNQWNPYDQNTKVYYLSGPNQNLKVIQQLIQEIQPSFIYLNSMYSKVFTLFPLLLKWRGQIKGKIVLAPRGMLRSSALQIKPLKKKIFLRLLKISRVPKTIQFHATDPQEKQDILHQLNIAPRQIFTVSNFPCFYQPDYQPITKRPFELKTLFIARIHPIKNLLLLLEALMDIPQSFHIHLSIYGPEEAPDYWKKCQTLIGSLPPHIKVSYRGAIPHPEIEKAIRQHHLFVLPTTGENFGHVIFESFLAGRPVLISEEGFKDDVAEV